MLNGKIKKEIYALASIAIIILIVASFTAAMFFLLKINNLIFNVNDRLIRDKIMILDKSGFDKIKDNLSPSGSAPENIIENTIEPSYSPLLEETPLEALSSPEATPF